MKKSTIGILILSLLLILIGGGLFVGGIFAAGGIGAAKDVLEKHGVFFEHGFHIDIDSDDWNINNFSKESMMFHAENVRSIDLEIEAAEVEIVQDSQTEEISVRAEKKCNIYLKNGVLNIETDKLKKNNKLIVEIPSDQDFDSVEISVGAGRIEVEQLKTIGLEMEVGAGEIIINDCAVKDCDISVGMGNAEIYLDDDAEDYNYEIECGAGNVQIGNESFGGLATERSINNHADASIDIECGMGNVTIGF